MANVDIHQSACNALKGVMAVCTSEALAPQSAQLQICKKQTLESASLIFQSPIPNSGI
jgi:hypothetical protein